MKLVRRVRFLFQAGVLLAFFLVFGTVGALETDMINPVQFAVQLTACTGFGVFCARMSRRRFFIRLKDLRHLPFSRHRRTILHAAAEYCASSSHSSTICLYGSIFVGFGSLNVYSGFCGDSAYRFAVRGSMWYFRPSST